MSNESQLDRIRIAVGQAFQVDDMDLFKHTRQLRVAWPRQVACFLALESGLDRKVIQEYWGMKSAANVSRAGEAVKTRMSVDRKAKVLVLSLQLKLKLEEPDEPEFGA